MLEGVFEVQNRASRPRTTLKELFCEDSPSTQSREDIINFNQNPNHKLNNNIAGLGHGKYKENSKHGHGLAPKEESNKLNHSSDFGHGVRSSSPVNGLNYGSNTEQSAANVNGRADYRNPNLNSNGFGNNQQPDRVANGNLNPNTNPGYAHNYGGNREQTVATVYLRLNLFTANDYGSNYGPIAEQSAPITNYRVNDRVTDGGHGINHGSKTEKSAPTTNYRVNDRVIDGGQAINHGTKKEQSTRTDENGEGVQTGQSTRTVNDGRVPNGNLRGLFYGLKTEPVSSTGNDREENDNPSHAGNTEKTDSVGSSRVLDRSFSGSSKTERSDSTVNSTVFYDNLSKGAKTELKYSTVNSRVIDNNQSHDAMAEQSNSIVNQRVLNNNPSHGVMTERSDSSVNQRVLSGNLSHGAKAEQSTSALYGNPIHSENTKQSTSHINARMFDNHLDRGENTEQSTSHINAMMFDNHLDRGENTVQNSHGGDTKQSILNARLLNDDPVHSYDGDGYGNNPDLNSKQGTTATGSIKVINTPNGENDDHGLKHGASTENGKGRKMLGFRSSSVRKVITFSQELVTARFDDKKVSQSGPLTAHYLPKQSALKRTTAHPVPPSNKIDDPKPILSCKSSPVDQKIGAEHVKSLAFEYKQGQWHDNRHGQRHEHGYLDSASEQAMAKISEFERSWESHYEQDHDLNNHGETGNPEVVERHHPLCTECFVNERSKHSDDDKRHQNAATKLIKNIGRKLGDKDKKLMMNKKQMMCTVQIPEGMVGLGWQEGIPLMLSSGSYRFPVSLSTGRCSFKLQKLQSEKATITVHGDLHRTYIRDGHLGVAWVQGKPLMLQPGVSLFTCPPQSFSLITTHESPHLLHQKEFVLGPFRIILVAENEVGIKFCNRQPEILHSGRHYLSISRLEIFAGFESLLRRHTHVNGVNLTAMEEIPVTIDVSMEWQIKAEDAAIARASSITDVEGAVCEKVRRAIGLVMWNFDAKAILKQPLDPQSEQVNKSLVLNETDPVVRSLSSNIAREFIELFEEGWSITLWELKMTKFVTFPDGKS